MKKFLSILLVCLLCLQFPIITFAEKSVKNGDIVFFGNYPQTLVNDNKLVKELDAVAKKWVSFNYRYYETEQIDGQKVQKEVFSDAMQYADFSYNGENYRGINFVYPQTLYSTMHWPHETICDKSDKEFNYVFYFKYEPIAWIVVDAENGILMSQKSLDQQEFNTNFVKDEKTGNYYLDDSKEKYANDYSESTLRHWLNNNFISVAFTSEQVENLEDNFYDIDEYHLFQNAILSKGYSIVDKVAIPSSTEFIDYNNKPITPTDYCLIQGRQEKALITRTAYDSFSSEGKTIRVLGYDNLEGTSISVQSVGCIVPVIKLSSITDNSDIVLFENGNSCGCTCHKLQHSDNFLGKFFYRIIKTIWELFSINKYCECNLKHY